MAQNPWTRLTEAMRGEPAPPTNRRGSGGVTADQAAQQRAAARQREMQAALNRAQAARPSRPLTAIEREAIQRRYQ